MEEERKDPKEEQEHQEAQDTTPKKGFPVNIIIICILGLCVLGGGLFAWKSGMLSRFSGRSEARVSDKSPEESTKDIGPIYSMDTFIVNLIGGRGKNYLKAKIELEMDNAKLVEEINKRLPQFRDTILTMLSSKTYDDIKTLEGKFQLREEIISILNQHLNSGKIKNVYFTDFIVQ
jgi:flagellar FliL protein